MGQATAILFAEAGCEAIFITGRRAAKLEETKKHIVDIAPKCAVYTLAGDVSKADDRASMVTHTKKHTRRVDILVNNAGMFANQELAKITDDDWEQMFATNLTAVMALTRDLLSLLTLSKHASVINISSTLAIKPIPATAAYNASKAALLQLTKSLALELGPQHIRVNSILPAIVATPMYRGRFENEQAYHDMMTTMAKHHPLQRVGAPEDIANACLYLASDAASWVTGVNLPVDGGMLCT